MEWRNGDFLVTTDPDQVDVDVVFVLLSQSYWAAGRPKEVIGKSIRNSLCFTLLRRGNRLDLVGL